MRNMHGFKVRCYSAHLIDINDYLAVFPGETANEKYCEMELNEILLNSISNILISQACMHGFDC